MWHRQVGQWRAALQLTILKERGCRCMVKQKKSKRHQTEKALQRMGAAISVYTYIWRQIQKTWGIAEKKRRKKINRQQLWTAISKACYAYSHPVNLSLSLSRSLFNKHTHTHGDKKWSEWDFLKRILATSIWLTLSLLLQNSLTHTYLQKVSINTFFSLFLSSSFRPLDSKQPTHGVLFEEERKL